MPEAQNEDSDSAVAARGKSQAQRVGLRGFPPPAASPSALQKPDANDYPDLFEEDGAKTTQTAGPAVASGKPKAGDYADLFEDTGQAQSKATTPNDESGLFGALPRQIQEHPYIAGGLAALAVPAIAAVGAEVGIPALVGAVGGSLIGLLRSEGFKIGSGLAFGQELSPGLHHSLHYLLRLSGLESDH